MAGIPKNQLAPRVETSAEFAGKKLNHRARAMLDSVFDLMDGEQARGTFDPRKALRAAFERDPLGYLERVVKLTPEGPVGGAVGGMIANIGAMYLHALQAPVQVVAPLVDVTPEAGYNAGTEDAKPLITQGDW